VDQFTSNQDQIDQRPILHNVVEYISPAKMLRFVIFVCNYLGATHVCVAAVA